MSPDMELQPRAAAILVAAGSSSRMAAEGRPRKPLLELEGATVLERAALAFERCPLISCIVLVGHEQDLARLESLAERSPALAKVAAIVAGGEERTDSVRRGMERVPEGAPLVAIHDAARPLVREETVRRCILAAAESGAALVAVPVADTVKHSADGRSAERTLDRSALWLAQTPQVFRTEAFRELLARAAAEGFSPTDDAALHERYSGPVTLVPGQRDNFKITTPEDLALAAVILRAREAPPSDELSPHAPSPSAQESP